MMRPSSKVMSAETPTQPHGLPAARTLHARKPRTTPPIISAMPSIRVKMVAASKGLLKQMTPAAT